MSDETIICRCEDITLSEVRELIGKGHHTTEQIKRACRCGMGPCQGRTCMPLIAKEIAKETGKPVSEVMMPTHRPPTAPITLGALARGGKNEKDC